MAIMFEQYLQSLLQSVTTYYTATYSSDTELYSILQMYSDELASGSATLETVRNNLFVVTCENSKLYDNFGTYFDQGKYTDQTYVEDRYISGSGTFRITTPALKVTQVVESPDDGWTFISHDSLVTNFPYSFDLGQDDSPPYDYIIGQPLTQAAAVGGKLYSVCTARVPVVSGDPIPQYFPLIRLLYYDIAANAWNKIPTVCGDVVGDYWLKLDNSGVLMVMGLVVYQPYLGRGKYDPTGLYSFDLYPTNWNAIGGTWTDVDLVGVKYFNLDTTPEYSHTNGFLDIVRTDISNISYTESVSFHDKIYMALASKSTDGPDSVHRWPFLVYYNPVTNDVGETGLAIYMSNNIGNIDFQLHAMAKYDNKLWIDSSQDIEDFPFSGAINNSDAAPDIHDFESSGSTIFAATGLSARLLHSIDEGNIWNEKVDLTYMDADVDHLYCCKEFDAQDGSGSFLYVGTDHKLVFRARAPHTSGSWSSGSFDLSNVMDLETFDSALFAATYQGSLQYVYRTTNGTTWTQVNAAPAEVVNKGGNAFKEFNGYLYAAGPGSNNVIRSSDGITWADAVDGLGTAGTYVGYYLEAHNGYLYSTNTAWHLVRTSNGTTWNTRYTGFNSQINSILSYQNTLYVGLGNGELWSSTDDGETFVLFQNPSPWYVNKLDTHNGYAFCGTFDSPKGGIFKWGGGSQHYMTTYDGTNFADATSPASEGDTILKMHSYGGQLYAIMINSTGGYTVRRYNGTSWSTHHSFAYSINTMYEHKGFLIVSLANGDIFYLDTENDTWQQYLAIPDLSLSTNGVVAFASYTMSTTKLYSLVDNAWYSSEFISSDDIIHYAISGAGISGSTTQYASIPGYRKQLDFMLDAAMHGGTHQGVIRASNAFTLINPDIREAHTTPQWKLKSAFGPITQLSPNVWQFSSSPSWRDNLWQGSHATFTSGSSTSDKIAVGYVILVNDNNTVDVGPIYDPRLLLDLTRPN